MNGVEREACFHCGEPVALDARVCLHCSRSALVVLTLPSGVSDARRRYQVARAVVAQAPSLGPINALTTALGATRPRLGPLTRSAGYRALEALQAHELAGEFEPGEIPRSRPPLAWIAAAAVALLAAGWLLVRSPKQAVPAPAAAAESEPAAAATAARAAPRASLSARDLAARTLPSTVLLRCEDSIGSGFVVAPETIVTNAHVLCKSGTAPSIVTPDGKSYVGGVLATDTAIDLASLKVPGLLAPPLPLADATALAPGDRVLIAGNPMGLEFSVSEGIVSNVSQLIMGVSYIQTDAKINPGNSGGPLVDDQGRVVGVVSLKMREGEGIGFALPINYAWDHNPRLAEPPSQVDTARWQGMLGNARTQNEALTSAASEALSLPVLVSAGVDPYKNLVVRIARISSFMPVFEEITVRFLKGEEVVCTLKGDISEWKAVEGRTPFANDPRMRAWLDANNLGQTGYVGESALRWDQCPREQMRPGIVIELQNANPEASRLRLN